RRRSLRFALRHQAPARKLLVMRQPQPLIVQRPLALAGEPVHPTQPIPQPRPLHGRKSLYPLPCRSVVVLGNPRGFALYLCGGELLAPDVCPDAVEDQVKRLVPVEIAWPLDELPQMTMPELVDERRLLDRLRVARPEAHRMVRPARVAGRIVDVGGDLLLRER